jgi:hypothetical protein
VFAFTYGASDGSQAQAEGDRVPKFGAIDTSTGNVVVRDPVRTRINTVTNVGQASAGSPYYITGASFASIADQFFTSLYFSQPIGSAGTLVGQLDLDSDRSLDTGDIPMRGAIQDGTGVPSFGGDTSLWFRLGGIEGALIHLEHDQSYDPFDDPDAVFGGQDNDGRWVVSGSTLTLVSSISTFDPFQITFKDPLTEASTRFSTYPNQGDMYARCTLTDELGTVTYDSLPRGLGSGVVDTATGQVVAPLTLDQNQNRWVAPPSPVGILAAPDFIEVDAEVVGGNLVVKGVLEQLPSRDIGTEYAIYLDTSPSGGFVPDYEVTITTDEGYTGFIRSATLISPDGSASGHDTWVNVDAHDVDDFDSSGQPVHGSFTVTIPLNELKNVGPKLDLYVASLDTVADPGFVYDVAPHDKNGNISPPLEVDTGNEPTVVTPASATPSPVTGTTTTLSVLGDDDGGEANLTYTWAATTSPSGAAAPTFSANGTNAAKQTVATFSKAGTYGFTVTIADAAGLTTTSSVNVVVNQSLTSIAVSPASATVKTGGTQQFAATAKDQFGNVLATQPSFTWTTTVGTISAGGLLTAPSTSAKGTVTAASGAFSAKASVTVNPAPTVATPASATPSPVTGIMTTLSVLGADAGGEATLKYTWVATTLPRVAAAPTFSANGTNAAKKTMATFSMAGIYGFTVTIADAAGLTTTSSVQVTVNQTLTSITVSPASVTVKTGGTQQFAATAKDQFGNALTTQPSFKWAATAGTITTGGLFTAPTTTGGITVTATSGSFKGSATVNVTTPLTPPAAPSFTATAVSATQINLAWTPVAGATGYLVDQWINGAWAQVGSLSSGSTSYTVTGLSPNTTYYFDVAAYNAAGTTWANSQSATTFQNTGVVPAPNAVTSPNWSGYVAETNLSQPQPNSVTEVSGSWVVPTVTGPSTGSTYSAVWVGIDGADNSTVEQDGTSEDVINGQPVYQAWWEMWSSGDQQPGQVISSMTVEPGDSITASVQYITSGAHAGQFYLSIVDNSRPNDSFSIYASSSQYQSPLAQRSSAEWIVEAPEVGGNIAEVANFGSVTFTNASAVINGVSGPINASSWQSQAWNIVSNGVTYDTTSVLTNSGTSFVVTYNPSAGAAVRAGTNAAAGTASAAAVGTALRSGKTIAGPVIRGSAWAGASVVSGFRTPVRQHKRPTQGFVIDPLWN